MNSLVELNMPELNVYQRNLLTQFTNFGVNSRDGREAMRKLLVTIESQEIEKESF